MTNLNLNNVKETLYSASVVSKTYGQGIILDTKVTEDFKILVTIAFEEKTTTFDLAIALASRFIIFVDPSIVNIANNMLVAAQEARSAAQESARLHKLEQLKKAEELKNKKACRREGA